MAVRTAPTCSRKIFAHAVKASRDFISGIVIAQLSLREELFLNRPTLVGGRNPICFHRPETGESETGNYAIWLAV
jgi:hypothetical protein